MPEMKPYYRKNIALVSEDKNKLNRITTLWRKWWVKYKTDHPSANACDAMEALLSRATKND